MEFSTVNVYSNTSVYHPKREIVVWSTDANLQFSSYPHILLFLVGLVTLLVLWLPYTILLLIIQWVRRLPNCKVVSVMMCLHPSYDAYLAPLKQKHQYWFGVLLLARGILLVSFASLFGISNAINI